ncbi:MAG: PLP-dependent transferase, partial [Pseudomonadota bacterium]|nr:PLP-dependent transferase [Pseudomonadota bacterium]
GDIAHKAGIPLMIDATFNTPWLLKPVTRGVDIIIHSLTKWMGGHGIAIGGAVVDGGNFDWGQNDKFPTISQPHYSMDGINFHQEYGPVAFTAKFRAEAMYNFGPCLSPTNAFHLLQGLETLPLRMQRHMDNTFALLEFLSGHEDVAWVRHPNLPDHPGHEIASRLMPRGAGSIISFGVKGGRDAGRAFIESVQLASHLANVGDAKTLVIHPASTTHSHIDAEAMKQGGLSDDMSRLSVGLEDIEDIKADFELGFRAARKKTKG